MCLNEIESFAHRNILYDDEIDVFNNNKQKKNHFFSVLFSIIYTPQLSYVLARWHSGCEYISMFITVLFHIFVHYFSCLIDMSVCVCVCESGLRCYIQNRESVLYENEPFHSRETWEKQEYIIISLYVDNFAC